MFRGVLNWLAARFRSEAETDEVEAEDKEPEDTRFVPSVLDASVRYAHGGSNTGLECEMAEIEEEARRLEGQRRDE